MYDVYEIRKQFPMLTNNIKMQGHPLVFLDNASTTFKPKCVIDKINQYYNFETSNSHRGDYDLCYNMDVEVENARRLVAKFINAEENEIVFMEAFNCGNRATVGELVSKYILLYCQAAAIFPCASQRVLLSAK